MRPSAATSPAGSPRRRPAGSAPPAPACTPLWLAAEWDCRQIESVWANTKNGLGNLAAGGANQLTSIVQEHPALTDGFLA